MKKCIFMLPALLVLYVASAHAADTVALPGESVVGESEAEDATFLSPGAVTVVKPEEMEGEQKSLPELLNRVSGLHIIEAKGRGAYTVASVRGSTGSQVTVFVDGTKINLGSEAAVDLSAIPVENVERIEVYRGYVPARFAGASMGGVINIITKKPEGQGGSVTAGTGSFGKFETSLTYNTTLGGGNLLFGSDFERTDGNFEYLNDNGTPYNRADDYMAKRQNNGYKNTDFLLKWQNCGWTVRGTWKKNGRDLVYEAPGADKPVSLAGPRLDTKTADFSILRRQTSGAFDWGMRLDYIDQKKIYDDPNNFIGGWGEKHNEYRSYRLGVLFNGSLQIGENHLLEFFADYADECLDVDGDIITTLGGRNSFSRETWNVQLQDTISLVRDGSLWLTPIVRCNASDGDDEFSWGAALSKSFGNWTLKATGGTYNRAPNLYERYGDGAFLRPNAALLWEYATQWDIGASWYGSLNDADITFSLAFFSRYSDNLIEYVMVSPRNAQYQNVGEAEVSGVEVESSVEWRNWHLFLAATWMQTENATPDGLCSGAPLPNRPEWEALARLSRTFTGNRLTAFAEFSYVGENYYDLSGNIKMDSLATVGLGIKYDVTKDLRLTLWVDDVFDKSPSVNMYAMKNGPSRMMWYPQQGRTFYATLSWVF